MNILFLSKNVDQLKASNYQFEFLKYLKRNSKIYTYGEGYKNYNINDNYNDIIIKSGFRNFDIVLFSHSWLNDQINEKVTFHSNLCIPNSIFKVAILNKEYVNLVEKIDYFENEMVNLLVTHNQELSIMINTKLKILFLPFGIDDEIFKYSNDKKIDLMFSGIMRPTHEHKYSRIRLKMHKKIFNNYFNFKFKKDKYKDLHIYWNDFNSYYGLIKDRIERFYRDSRISYANKLTNSKFCFNTLSPSKIINPRFFESLYSGAVPICHKSESFNLIKDFNNFIIEINEDLSDFDEKFFYYINNEKKYNEISKGCHLYAKNHTWNKRISKLFKTIKEI